MKKRYNKNAEQQSGYATVRIQGPSSGNNNFIWLPVALLIASITFLVYLPALKNGFVNWDDGLYVYRNPDIRSVDINLFKWSLTAAVASLWHPLTLLSLALDYAVWGLEPKGYHLTNIAFHSVNTFMVFILARRLLISGCSKRINIVATITALLFGLHPLHVESVAWISERKDVLSASFFLATLTVYLKYTAEDSKNKLLYGSCISLYIMALMSKPAAVSLPIILIILDFYPLGRLETVKWTGTSRWILIEKTPFFLLSGITSLITLWTHKSEDTLMTIEAYPLFDRTLVALRGYIFYVVKMALPIDLSPLYPHPVKPNLYTIEYIGSFIVLLLVTFYAIRSLRSSRLFFSIWLYYLVTLIPVIGFVQVGIQAAADRYTYLPSLGPFILAGIGVNSAFEISSNKGYRAFLVIALVVYFCLLSGETVRQIGVWHDSTTLWTKAVELYPGNHTAYYNRGIADYDARLYQQAISDFSRAVGLNPLFADAYFYRGNSYRRSGNNRLAISDFTKTIKLNPRNTIAYNNRGITYFESGETQAAINDFREAIKINPQDASAYNNLRAAYSKIGIEKQGLH